MKAQNLRRARTIAFASALLALQTVAAPAEPANSLRELGSQLFTCLRGVGVAEGADLTIAFSLKRDGALLGKPRITHSRLPEDPDARRRLVETFARAMDRCLPLSITDQLGAAIAGAQLNIRIGARNGGANI